MRAEEPTPQPNPARPADTQRPADATPWPGGFAQRIAAIRNVRQSDLTGADRNAEVKRLAYALTTDCTPAIGHLVEHQCRRLNRPDLIDDAMQNASIAVMNMLFSGIDPLNIVTYLRRVIYNAVSQCVTANGALHPTAAQRRRATISKANDLFLAEHRRFPSEHELLAAQHALMSSRADARDQAALASIGEVRAHPNIQVPFVEDGHTELTGDAIDRAPYTTDHRLPDHIDHVDDDLALDPIDTQRLIDLTGEACVGLHPDIDGPAFAVTVMTDALRGTTNVHRIMWEFSLTRSVVRTAVNNVWKTATRIARDDLGITSVRVHPGPN